MLVDENKLREILREAITDMYKQTKPTKDEFKELMHKMFNISAGVSITVLNGKLPVEIMQKDMLYKVTYALHTIGTRIQSDETFDYTKLKVEKFFTENEVKLFSVKLDKEEHDENITIKAGNWMQVTDDQFMIKIYPDELIEYYVNKNRINYNPETQRDLTIKETRTGKVKVITFVPDAYENICNNMANNMYIPDMLALNINPDYYEPPIIKYGNLIIPKESKLDCIDGWHRLKAAITTKLSNQEWNQPLTFFLFTCGVEKAVRYILQEDFHNHLSDSQKTKVDKTSMGNFITERLNNSFGFILKGTINNNLFVTLTKIIDNLYEENKIFTSSNRQRAVEIAKNIEKNINYVIEEGIYTGETTKEKWLIYIYVTKRCMDNGLNFMEVIRDIDIDSIVEEIKFANKPTPTIYKKLKEMIKNV